MAAGGTEKTGGDEKELRGSGEGNSSDKKKKKQPKK